MKSDCPNLQKPERIKEEGNKAKQSEKPPTVKARAYQMKINDAQEEQDVVSGTILLNSLPAYVLFDTGASRSFVKKSLCDKLDDVLTPMSETLEVETANDNHLLVSMHYPNCKITIDNQDFPASLIPLELGEFDVILGMDWLAKHEA